MPSAAGSVKNVDKTDILESDSVWTGQLTAENINATGGTIAGFEIGSSSTLRELGSDYYSVTVTRTQYSTSPVVRFNYTVSFSLTTKLEYDVMAIISLYDGETLLGSDDITIAAGSTTGIFTESEENTFIIENVSVTSVTTKADVYIYHTPYLAYNKETYNDENTGVYLGTNGIGLGAGSFYVTADGNLYANNAELAGKITATSGTIGGFTIGDTTLEGGVLTLDADSKAIRITGSYNRYTLASTSSSKNTSYIALSRDYGLTFTPRDIISGSTSTAKGYSAVYNNDGIRLGYFYAASNQLSGSSSEKVSLNIYVDSGTTTNSTPGMAYITSGNGLTITAGSDGYLCSADGGTWYLESGTPISSDRTLKKEIKEISEQYDELFDKLKPVIYKYKKETTELCHLGFIAQDVEEAIISSGLSAKDYAALAKNNCNGLYYLRYEEFIGLCVYEIQELKSEIKDLKSALKR